MKIKLFFSFMALAFFGFILEGEEISKQQIVKKVQQYRRANEHQIIKEFYQLLSIPNVSNDRVNIRRNAEFIKKMMQKRGIQSRLLKTKGNPVIFGELIVPDATQTLMFYIHYDGQPVDPSKWIDSKPFQPVLRNDKLEAGQQLPKPRAFPSTAEQFQNQWRIYARSSSDDKAPIIALLTALDALQQKGIALRNNIKFILDGEEEAGSPNLHPCLKENRNLLSTDVLFMCDGPTYFSGEPTLFFGCRGIASLEITVYGGNTNLHSGHFGNWAPNPALQLSCLLSSMKDHEGKITIKGFYDDVVPLSPGEKIALKAIPSYEKELKKLYGFSDPENKKISLMEAIQYPALNINGLKSGWVGHQARTIIPASATASIDLRLVKGNKTERLIHKIIAHIKNQGYYVTDKEPDQKARMLYHLIARVSVKEKGYPAYKISLDHPVSKKVIETLSSHQNRKLVLIPSLGGSLPIYMFADTLEVPIIGIPIANHDNNQHQPNENLRIEHLWDAIETFALIFMMGDINKK
ncbi:MAG: M20/M25/M40 family metallo-hydrolase [Candidatus Aminicenantes bacterium]|nr:M20/M25/M40 family metallo-hydrolase [Candidatus Aminicenantes bacterium]